MFGKNGAEIGVRQVVAFKLDRFVSGWLIVVLRSSKEVRSRPVLKFVRSYSTGLYASESAHF